MAEGTAKEPPSPDEVPAPANFLAFAGAALRLFRSSFRSVALRFILVVSVLMGGLEMSLRWLDLDRPAGTVVIYAWGVLLTTALSLLSARTGRIVASRLAGREVQAPDVVRELRPQRSHLLAAAAAAALVALLVGQFLRAIAPFLDFHLLMGPPVLVHVIAMENKSLQEAWTRAKSLIAGQLMRTFLYLLCAALALVMMEQIISLFVLAVLPGAIGENALYAAAALFAGGVVGLGLGIMSCFTLEAYLDLRTRYESFETEDLKRDLEVPASS